MLTLSHFLILGAVLFAISIVAHIIFILSAAFLTVIVIQSRQKVMFEGKKNPSIPARKLEHSIRVKQMQKQVQKQTQQKPAQQGAASPTGRQPAAAAHVEQPAVRHRNDRTALIRR